MTKIKPGDVVEFFHWNLVDSDGNPLREVAIVEAVSADGYGCMMTNEDGERRGCATSRLTVL